jgi:hypothetical protein
MRLVITRFLTCVIGLCLGASLIVPAVSADTSQNPQSGSIGLQGTISTTPPTKAATIITPSNGATFTTTPITVSGLCTTGLLVKIFDNNVFVGSTLCSNGSYSLQVDLFSGQNDLVARIYDSLDQAGPDSNTVSVIFNDAQFAQFGTRVTLTSPYARRGANPGDELDWPLILSGGVGPYALSTDWGDGSSPTLQSEAFAGNITIKHTYTSAGVYKVTVRASDKNGTAAYLQLVAVADGQITQSTSGKGSNTLQLKTVILWWPALLLLPLIVITFWLGRRHELYTLRKQLEGARKQ